VLSGAAASSPTFAASPEEPSQQESFLPRSVERAPNTGVRSTGPYDLEDRYVDPRGFPLGGWREIKNPPA
jgi:hypothetical protein